MECLPQQYNVVSKNIFIINSHLRYSWLALYRALFQLFRVQIINLTAKSIQSTSLSLQSVDHIHGGNSLPLGVLSVGDRVPDHVLQEDLVMYKSTRAYEGRNLTNLKNTSRLLVDQSRDSLDASPSRQPSDGRLSNALQGEI